MLLCESLQEKTKFQSIFLEKLKWRTWGSSRFRVRRLWEQKTPGTRILVSATQKHRGTSGPKSSWDQCWAYPIVGSF